MREESAQCRGYAAPFGARVWVEAGEGAAGGALEGLRQAATDAARCPASSSRRGDQPGGDGDGPCCCLEAARLLGGRAGALCLPDVPFLSTDAVWVLSLFEHLCSKGFSVSCSFVFGGF